MLLIQKDHCHHHDVILPPTFVILDPFVFLPHITTLSFPYIGYALVMSFCVTNHQHPHPHGTFVPCMPYHVPLLHNDGPFCFRALPSSCCFACFVICFTQSSNISIVFLTCPHPLLDPFTTPFLINAFVIV